MKTWNQVFSDCSGCKIWVFKKAELPFDKEDIESLHDNFVYYVRKNIDSKFWPERYYSGPGMAFQDQAYAIVQGSRVLITQDYGIDC